MMLVFGTIAAGSVVDTLHEGVINWLGLTIRYHSPKFISIDGFMSPSGLGPLPRLTVVTRINSLPLSKDSEN